MVAPVPNERQSLFSEFFRSLLLSFSPALDEHNPDILEWREDVGRVVRTALSQVHQASVTPGCFLPPAALSLITISCRRAILTEGTVVMLPAWTLFIYLSIYLPLVFEISLADRKQTVGVLVPCQMEANVKTKKERKKKSSLGVFFIPLFNFSLFYFLKETLLSKGSREAEKKTLDATAELCDTFVVVASPQVSGVPEEQLLVFLYPGLPTTAELFILPDENGHGEHKKDSEEALETVRKKRGRAKKRLVKLSLVRLTNVVIDAPNKHYRNLGLFFFVTSFGETWQVRESFLICSILIANRVKQWVVEVKRT